RRGTKPKQDSKDDDGFVDHDRFSPESSPAEISHDCLAGVNCPAGRTHDGTFQVWRRGHAPNVTERARPNRVKHYCIPGVAFAAGPPAIMRSAVFSVSDSVGGLVLPDWDRRNYRSVDDAQPRRAAATRVDRRRCRGPMVGDTPL